ncbi:MAG TPA: serine protease [Acidobacteriota bacterium]|nr:serine protease [Acidobacteriota bacterium]
MIKRFLLFLLPLVTIFAAEGTDIKSSALTTLPKIQKAIVTVKVQANIKMRGQDQEQKLEVTGTMIDPSGLTVVSEQSINPASMLSAFMSSYSSRRDSSEMKFESQITETLIVLDDGSEVPADVVLKDEDLDLAFIKPKQPSDKFVHIPFKPREKPLELLEDFFVVSRLGRSENRAIHMNLGSILSIVKGPRTFYVCDQEISGNSLGVPAFDSDGSAIGLFVTRKNQGGEDNSMNALLNMMIGKIGQSGSVWILRPVEDILEVAEQALNPDKD